MNWSSSNNFGGGGDQDVDWCLDKATGITFFIIKPYFF